jgi:hypothetical protein
MSNNIVVLKAKGLNTSPNELDREEGSLIEANNIIIRRDGVIEKIRGTKTWGAPLPSEEDRASQLFSYRNRIIRHHKNTSTGIQGLQYDNDGEGTFLSFDGQYNEVQDGLRIKTLEESGNLFFTTSEGVKKISALTSDDFTEDSGYITQAGGIKATNFEASLVRTLGEQSGFLAQDSTISYKVLWGTKDKNNNLILGTPSQFQIITNKLSTLLTSDFVNLLSILDNLTNYPAKTTRINDKDYISKLRLNLSSTAVDLRKNLIALCEKIDNDIFIAATLGTAELQITDVQLDVSTGICTITTNLDPSPFLSTGKNVKISNLKITDSTTDILNGKHSVTVDSTSKTIIYKFADIIKQAGLSSFPGEGTTNVVYLAQDTGKTYLWLNSEYLETNFKDYYTVEYATNNYANLAAFPATPAVGFENDVYLALDTKKTYVWNGTAYVEASIIEINTVNYKLVEHSNLASFEPIGDANNLYLAQDTNRYYIWSNSVYIEVSASLNTPLDFSTTEVHYAEYSSLTQPSEIPTVPALNSELVTLQTYLEDIKIKLVNEPETIIAKGSDLTSLNNFQISNSAKVKLEITIPNGITSNYFCQIYRSKAILATGTRIEDLTPYTETFQIYEAYPTESELTNKTMVVIDNTPDDFMKAGLYTNEGREGGDATNDEPPLAKDVNRFKNCVFYANTQTKQKLILNLLGVEKILEDYNLGIKPSITIANKSGYSSTYKFVKGIRQESTIIITKTATQLNGKYFTLDSSLQSYYVWFRTLDALVPGTDPLISGKTGIKVDLLTSDNAVRIGQKLRNALCTNIFDFYSVDSYKEYVNFASLPTDATVGDIFITLDTLKSYGWDGSTYAEITPTVNKVTVIDNEYKLLNTITDINTECVFSYISGQGEGGDSVLLSDGGGSAAIAVEETTKSLIRIINKNEDEIVSAFYLSSVDEFPGNFVLEARTLTTDFFYISTNNSVTGLSFSPNLSPLTNLFLISTDNPTMLYTSTAHGLFDNDYVFITTSEPDSPLNGIFPIKRIDADQFTVNVATTGLLTGGFTKLLDANVSENEIKPNRVYFSKRNEPEAVPLSYYIDIGAKEKEILRIFPLRDSLFVFKEDGLYRISGESFPFSSSLFDSSVNLLAADSVCLVDNLLYCWTTQGIQIVSESGTQTISRPIDNIILKLASHNYPYFKTATWGIGYGADSSVTMWTVNPDVNKTSQYAEIGFRYNTLTNSWTTISKSPTCGFIFDHDNTMYLGASDISYIEQERKTFTRLDYSGRQYNKTLDDNKLYKNTLKLSNVDNLQIGSGVVQEQRVTISEFNTLLNKLDFDPFIGSNDYNTLKLSNGQNLRQKIVELAHKLDNDTNIKGSLKASQSGGDIPKIESVLIDSGICIVTFSGPDARTFFSIGDKISLTGFSPENGSFVNKILLTDVSYHEIKFETTATGIVSIVNARIFLLDYYKDIDSKSGIITNITSGKTPIITCVNHGLLTGRKISLGATNTTPNIDTLPSLNNEYTVTVVDKDSFHITANVKIAGTTGTFSTIDEDFEDIAICYNSIINKLNFDIGAKFTDYPETSIITLQETIIEKINILTKEITLSKELPFLVGELIFYDSIDSSFTYSPNTFGDPLNHKQIRQATIMMDSRNITKMSLEFKTDLKPAFIPVQFNLEGTGIFGHDVFGENLFGGLASAVPIRTYIPMDCQRCRYMIVRFNHNIARESLQINGLTLTGNISISERAYR